MKIEFEFSSRYFLLAWQSLTKDQCDSDCSGCDTSCRHDPTAAATLMIRWNEYGAAVREQHNSRSIKLAVTSYLEFVNAYLSDTSQNILLNLGLACLAKRCQSHVLSTWTCMLDHTLSCTQASSEFAETISMSQDIVFIFVEWQLQQ